MIYLRKSKQDTPLVESDSDSKPENDKAAVRLIIFLLGIFSGLCIAAIGFHSGNM
jgi:hypothetical protein